MFAALSSGGLVVPRWDLLAPYLEDSRVQKAGAAVLGTGLVVKVGFAIAHRYSLRQRRLKKAKQCKDDLDKLRDRLKDCPVSAEQQKHILALSLAELIDELQTGKLKAVEVLQTYQIKALEVHRKTNCLVEPILEAQEWAEELDAQKGKKGPLHGVPISLKDNFGVKGYDCCVGVSKLCQAPFDDDSVVVKVLKAHGAIPFVKTNVPQTMVSWDTINPILGQTVNPLDSKRTVGGSSGGEGAILAGGGSILGMGSDIGGSIRIPCMFCGVTGIKPTCERISTLGLQSIMKGQNVVRAGYGPMAKDVESLIISMRVLLSPDMFKLDPLIPPLPFNNQIVESKRKLRIGYYTFDGFVSVTPACERAVHVARDALQKMGHELVPIDYSWAGDCPYLYARSVCGDQGVTILETLRGDAKDASMKGLVLYFSLGVKVKKFMAMLLKPFSPNLAKLIEYYCGCSTVNAWWEHVKDVADFRQRVTDFWMTHQLDAMLCPGFTSTAMIIGDPPKANGALAYTAMYNLLDFPAGSLPVTKVTKEDDEALSNYPTPDPWGKVVKKSAANSAGLPVNVQIVTLPYQEELCLKVMKDVEQGLK